MPLRSGQLDNDEHHAAVTGYAMPQSSLLLWFRLLSPPDVSEANAARSSGPAMTDTHQDLSDQDIQMAPWRPG
ncbi:hypothetical protein VSDG_05438 [Cytospora chrysosperma]|uniref:Uncharacterized protein n=1 Tax=Cytospora chrysosperma TaxID=252740 RepID=A0A423VZI2_CYTCH|nr:hypothetical protein VSDG_05438 [Valsa sordida]